MIVSKLAGGLGNQMFQVAAGVAAASRLGTVCKYDLSWYRDNHVHNGLEIDKVFDIDLENATFADLKGVLNSKILLYKALGQRCLSDKFSFITRSFAVDESRFLRGHLDHLVDQKAFMVGYWQSEIYFGDAKKEIRNMFRFCTSLSTNSWANKIRSASCPVAIHVRRGDYVSDSKSRNILGVCSVGYYRQAVSQLVTLCSSAPTFFVFSDDIEWAHKHFTFLGNAFFVEGQSGSKSYIDMELMSFCKHHIIANSSFSWWGAWLGSSSQQIVFAPKPWFDQGNNIVQICPKNWRTVSKNFGD